MIPLEGNVLGKNKRLIMIIFGLIVLSRACLITAGSSRKEENTTKTPHLHCYTFTSSFILNTL